MTKRNRKKTILPAACLLLAACLFLGLCLSPRPVYGASNVNYEGGAQGFVFVPGGDGNPTDLFDGFKEVMPGDELEDRVIIHNRSDQDVRIYLRATGGEAAGKAFLAKLTLKVSTPAGKVLFDGSADKKGGLADWVLLGTFGPGEETELILQLKVPLDLGNEYQNATGYVGWEFKAEEGTPDDDPEDPGDNPGEPGTIERLTRTWDENKPLIAGVLLTVAAAIVLGGLRRRATGKGTKD